MPSLQNIKRRIKSVQSTAQLTKAMQMVASMRFRANQVIAIRSAQYRSNLSYLYTKLDLSEIDPKLQPFFRINSTLSKTLMVLISPQRGFCGGLHRSSVSSAYQWLLDNNLEVKNPESVEIITINQPAFKQVSNYGGQIRAGFNEFARSLVAEEVLASSELIFQLFEQGGFAEVQLVYVLAHSQQAIVEQILPLTPIDSVQPSNSTIDCDPASLTLELIHQYLHSVIYDGIAQTMAAEEKARMIAMNQASENAKKLTGSLKLSYFKQRQANITQEMSEIIGCA